MLLMATRLPHSFYDRSTLTVARELLGKVLVLDEGGHRRSGRIVETEAYVGERDLACHASKGRTPRTEVLFGPPGISYVYLIYGMYSCFNAVTRGEGLASAVLVRGLEPVEGLDPHAATDGPGKLCRAMGITREHNRLDLTGDRLFIEDAPLVPRGKIERGPRIGVDYAGEWADKPYRFWIKDNPHVSRMPRRRAS
jgi:DNA-3-methyladenine glycosylase